MQDRPKIDEAFEARAATKLMLRGFALAIVAGLLWHLPTGYWLGTLLAKIIAAFAALYAVMPLAPASMVFRNIIGRKLNLWDRKRRLLALGFAIFTVLLALAALIFRLAGAVFG